MPVEQGEVQTVQLIDGPALAVARIEAPLRPFLLVHGESSDSSVWAQVAERLVAAGHEIAAVDLRGHGRSETPDPAAHGYDTDTCADDLATLLDQLGYTGGRSPIVVGHGWGANVALSLAARRDGLGGVCCVDGGWTRPAWRYPSFERFWAAREPGAGATPTEDDDPLLARRRSIARSVFLGEPRAWYPLISVPVVLCPVVPPDGVSDPDGGGTATRTGIAEALTGLPRARVSWYYGDGTRVLATEPGRIADDLLTLAADAEPEV
ncbi:alpha/beta fold hydrolase [Kineosporia sp. J2-2]|uniref:Alpha/beta fold hydrolase n=1 Tax=Kineosporia corallincola TaxID=2835133 RepID=A0ABS5TA65_9ACTN|nr:alpha/beta fold hydrolase [Kineosporia corallincola]MBT0767960.1 alpha/beta fold hydrolase [Kineosporia corallincola]